MSYESLQADTRPEGVKPVQMRKQGIIPIVLYGANEDSISLAITESLLMRTLNSSHNIFEIKIGSEDTKYLVNIDTVQRDPVTRRAIHVAFRRLRQDQEAKIVVPIHFDGRPEGEAQGGVTVHQIDEIELVGLPHNIPEKLTLDLTDLQVGESKHLKDVTLPAEVRFSNEEDAEKVVCTCNIPKVKEEEPVAAEEGEEAEGEAAAGEAAAGGATEEKKEEK